MPNVPGPVFNMVLNDNGVYSPVFEILAADGSHVSTVSVDDNFSNIMPQTATPIWYPNDPHKGAAVATQPPASSSTGAATAVPTTPTIVFLSASVVPLSSLSKTVTPSAALDTPSPLYLTIGPSATVAPTFTTLALSTVTFCSKCAAVSATLSVVPYNGTVTAPKNATTAVEPRQSPTQAVTNAAVAVKGGMGAAIVAAVVGAVAWITL